MLAGAIVGLIAIALIVAYNTRHLTPNLDLEDIDRSATLQGYHLAQLLLGALGALFVTGEYGTGMIRSTLAAVPKRTPVVWAKLVVFVSVVAVTMIPASIVAFVSAEGVISGTRHGYSLSDPEVLRMVLGTGVHLILVGVIAAAIGWLVRNTAGAIVTYVAVILVIPGIVEGLLGTWGKDIAQYLPSRAGESFSTTFVNTGPNLKPWTGLAVMILWVADLLAVALVQLRQRDA